MYKKIATIITALTGVSILLAACSSQQITPTANPPPISTIITSETVPEGASDPTATIQPKELRVLTICTGQEPASLFLYGNPSGTARGILEAIYDGPYDRIEYGLQPVILEQMPSLENGLARLEPVEVRPGDLIVDNDGDWATLREGTTYRPSGCSSSECARSYTGSATVQMDSLIVSFSLLPGMTWSDGNPLTAGDSVYSFELARTFFPAYRPELTGSTRSYEALDDRTVEWRGLPGYMEPGYASNFFPPFPRHTWSRIAIEEIATAEITARRPMGWGPYIVEDWIPGEQISLEKNPHYFRADEGLPHFDRLVFRFTASGEEAMEALLSGECDLADESSRLASQANDLLLHKDSGRLSVYIEPGGAWEHIVFGITPIDDQRPALFEHREVRQAVASCIDRVSIAREVFAGQSYVPDSFVSTGRPLYNPDVRQYPYDPQAAADQLTRSGWIDHDNDPATPRVSQGVTGFPDGTSFTFSYLTSPGEGRERVAQVIKDSLSGCGIQVEVTIQEVEELYAGGPEGTIFGRQFDAAQLGWMDASELICTLYSTSEIPGPYPEFPKGWGGANASGFSNPEFDQACNTSLTTLPGNPAYREAFSQVQLILAEELPALPLYLHLRVAAARPDLCGFSIDSSSYNGLWNLENLNYGEACLP